MFDDSDEFLIETLRQSGEQRLAEILSANLERLQRIVELRLDPRLAARLDAADVVQEAFLVARERLPRFLREPRVPVFVWLRGVLLGKPLERKITMKRWTILLASVAALAVAGYVVTAQQPSGAGGAPDDQPARRDRSARNDGKEARVARQAPAKSGIVSEFNKNPDLSVFVLRSSEVAEGGMLPKEFTGDGSSATLPLQWSGAPLGTRSFALIMHHKAPGGIKWYWVLYNIPADVTSLPKNVKGTGTLGNNSVNRDLGYAPPHSKGPGPKKYTLTVYALSAAPKITVPADQVSRDVLLAAMKDSILATADLNVIYSRGEQATEGDPRSASGQAGPPAAKTSLRPAAPGRGAGGEGQPPRESSPTPVLGRGKATPAR